MLRVLLPAVLLAGLLSPATAAADAECPPGGSPPPPGAVQRQVEDLDGDGLPDALWIGDVRGGDGTIHRFVGVSTAGGANSEVEIASASPQPLRALAVDAQRDGNHQIIVSTGRSAHLYEFAGCQLRTVVDTGGAPFVFDLQNLRGHGTGVGCADLGDGPHLVGLQALAQDDRWTIRRTEIDLNGTVATIGRSDTITAGSASDPAVRAAQTITCDGLSIDQDGVEEP
jgi:hypothetical protein